MLRALAVVIVSLLALTAIGVMGAVGASPNTQSHAGAFPPGVNLGLNESQLAQAARALTVADEQKAEPLAVLAMVVSALGESMFQPIFNHGGSGYCGVFQAHPRNIACHDTEKQAFHFLRGGKGFQAGGAMHLARTRSSLSPGTIATMVEASGMVGSFYDVHRPLAERIIRAWNSGGQSFPATPLDAASVQELLASPNLLLTPGQRADFRQGGFDPRLLATLGWIIERHTIMVCALRADHRPGTNHERGAAVDICVVDEWICRGGTNDPCARLARELAGMQGRMRSTELIYCWDPDPQDPNMWAQADHCDHIHLGFDA